MFKNAFLIFLNLFLLLNKIEGKNVTRYSFKNTKDDQQLVEEFNQSPDDAQPVLLNSPNSQVEDELDQAINDFQYRFRSLTIHDNKNEENLLDLTGGSLEDELADASKDDAVVPSSLDNSLVNDDDLEYLSLSSNSFEDSKEELEHISLNRVSDGDIPFGIIEQDYSHSDKLKLIGLYQSNENKDLKELFEFLAQHIHNKLTNCVSNFGKWIKNVRSGEPIFYRNCVPCTNAVDLNLQSLFNQQIHLNKLKHYFVNTCDMSTQWISYISDMKYLSVDLKRHPTTTFTDVIRQNLIPNQRYVFQGIVKSERGINHKGFFHVCNLINDESGHIWIIDGQIEKVFDLNQSDHIKQLDQKYRPDYIARASTGLFRPQSLIKHSKH